MFTFNTCNSIGEHLQMSHSTVALNEGNNVLRVTTKMYTSELSSILNGQFFFFFFFGQQFYNYLQ